MTATDSTERFAFGRNWRRFLSTINDERILAAEDSLREMLQVGDLEGRRVLDIGSGSGLFSLAAHRLGAEVHSFDYDEDSVACTQELRQRYGNESPKWTVEQGSVLDRDFVQALGEFDIVYSWGVLHHTGDMWEAISNATIPVADHGQLFIALYNDQGTWSQIWTAVKKCYVSGVPGRAAVLALFVPYFGAESVIGSLARGHGPFHSFRRYYEERGMSKVTDWVDWLGGYPFEVAKPDDVAQFLGERGFALQRRTLVGSGHGNNQFVFVRNGGS